MTAVLESCSPTCKRVIKRLRGASARSCYLPGVLHVVLLARLSAHAAAGGGAGLLRAAQHDGVLVEVAGSLHRHRHRAGLLAHVVAE